MSDTTKTEQITLTSSVDYHPRFPPANAKKAYVAKITGRCAGAAKYEREFLGESVTLVEGDAGLYERQNGDKKGGATRYYHVVLEHPEYGLIMSTDCEDELAKIAKLLDDGLTISEIVEPDQLRPSERHPGRWVFDVAVRTKQRAQAASAQDAVAACLALLAPLSAPAQKKALSEIKARLAAKESA
jgi:hypothetical protein